MTLLGACGTILCLSSQINTIIPEKNYNGKIWKFTVEEISYMKFVRNFVSYLSFKPQYQHAFSPHCSWYIFSGTALENLFNHQDISCLVIISNILMTSLFYQAVSLLVEIGCWPLVVNQVFDHAHLLCGFGGSVLSLMSQGHPATVSSQIMHWKHCFRLSRIL